MKKLVLSIAFMAVCAFGMNAQLTVLKSGNVKSGGSLEIRASDTTLQGGFTVNQGGTLTIYPQ